MSLLGENENPFKRNIDGIMQIGQRITVSVFLIDHKQLFDIKTTNCHLYDRKDFTQSRKINLTNEEGCSVDTQLFDGFKKIDNGVYICYFLIDNLLKIHLILLKTKTVQTDENMLNMLRTSENNQKILQSSKILVGNLNVVKFPEVTDIFVICNIEICKTNCDSKCHPPFKIEPYSTQQPSELKLTTRRTTTHRISPTWIQKDTTTTESAVVTRNETYQPEIEETEVTTKYDQITESTTINNDQTDVTLIETDYPLTGIVFFSSSKFVY